jgi:MFS family permease
MGLRRLLIVGAVLQATQYLALAWVHGLGWQLALFVAATVLGGVVYWTAFHAIYGAVGDSARRGSQVAARQFSIAVASVLGPAMGGIMLTAFGAWVAFGTAAAIGVAAIAPLFSIDEPPFERVAPHGGYAAARTGVLLFATDGWYNNSAMMAWNLIMFQSLGVRFDAFGGAFAAAVLAPKSSLKITWPRSTPSFRSTSAHGAGSACCSWLGTHLSWTIRHSRSGS